MLGYKQGLVVPFVSVYGRSGSGKSTIVKFVCENLDEDVSYAFVNLRKARTVFGCANLILAELGQPSLKSAQGINIAIEEISNTIEQDLSKKKNNTRLFILVLDEFDVLLYDKRGKPSDFIYKLLVMEEKLREKGYLMCIIAISNNVMSDYEIDDRVRSRIGTSEVFFEPYKPQAVLAMLQDRAEKAFSEPVYSEILRYWAAHSSEEHGDARRAIDLLRIAAEIAGKRGEPVYIQKFLSFEFYTVLCNRRGHLCFKCYLPNKIELIITGILSSPITADLQNCRNVFRLRGSCWMKIMVNLYTPLLLMTIMI